MSIFAKVAVDTYQDPTKRLFTYQVPENLVNSVKEGTKVVAPFGKRFVEGYIWSLTSERPPFPTKPIQTIKGPGFSKIQLKLAKWLTVRYLASPLDCLKCQIGGKGEKFSSGPSEGITTLVLVPYASQVKLRAATNKQKNTLVGSRSAVFAPLPNLQKIVMEEPENWNYKDERAPYYHAAEVAQKRAELEKLQLKLHYQTPRVEDFYVGKTNPSGLINSTRKVKVIDLNREKVAGNFTFVSSSMEVALSSGKYSLVYVNSRELRERVSEELRKISPDKNLYKVAGPELFALPGQEYFHTIWADVDTLLNLPDFRAHEKIIWTVQKLNQITKGELFLQTSSPENPLFKELESGPFDVAQGRPERSQMGGKLDSFYRRELKNRKKFSFPPFATLIKLSYSAKSSTKVYLEAEKLHEQLTAYSKRLTVLEISPPYAPYSRAGEAKEGARFAGGKPSLKTPGKVQLNIVIKLPIQLKPDRPWNGVKLAKVVPPDWKVEVDPESLL